MRECRSHPGACPLAHLSGPPPGTSRWPRTVRRRAYLTLFLLPTPSAAQLPDPARRHTACRDTPRTSPARRRTALPRAISAILDADCQVESRGERALPSRGIWKGVRLGLPGPPCRTGIGSLRTRRWSLVLRQVPEPELRPLAPQLGTPAAPQGA